ncbi:MAG: Fe-S protein assembly co-chaperone HscB [Janthinobacterium lividum]
MNIPASDDDHFALFGLARAFDVDPQALETAYRAVQARVHPDRFASAGDAQKRIAMQWAARVNEAYRVLREPLRRAVYLLQLRGIDTRAETSTAMDPAFLMQQIEWRESIDDAAAARNERALAEIAAELADARRIRLEKLPGWLDSGADQPAAETVRELLFIDRVAEAVETQRERLVDNA